MFTVNYAVVIDSELNATTNKNKNYRRATKKLMYVNLFTDLLDCRKAKVGQVAISMMSFVKIA